MSSYVALAEWYDQLTGDVPYAEFADFYEAEFRRGGGEFRLLLDLCCGTGTLTCELVRRGYELIAVDASVDMLMQAQEKAAELIPPRCSSVRRRASWIFTARSTRHTAPSTG